MSEADVARKRTALRDLYGPDWQVKVDNMSDRQIIAIYLRFIREGKIK